MDRNVIGKNKSEKYELIDILKFICAIFVVGIHSEIMEDSSNDIKWYILHIIFRIAVPFFFITSGFLFGKKYINDKENLKINALKQIKRLVIPFVFWMIISLPYKIITTEGANIFIILVKVVRSAIFYPWGALWFILAVIVAIVIEYFFIKKDKLNIAMILSGVLFVIALLGNSYYFLLDGTPLKSLMDIYLKVCISTRNGILVGFPIFTVGVFIAHKEKYIELFKKYKLYIGLILAILIQICEVTFIRNRSYTDDHSIFFTTIFIVAILLLLCIKHKNINCKKVDTKILRNLSASIYFMHAPILRYTVLVKDDVNNWIMFFGTIILTISISLILYKADNKYINYVIK